MNDIIQLLPDAIANQIAAGEVVQRPASIVKELLENALDAQSQSIQLLIKESGKSLVQVIDDGMGMSATDARMSFERHATSKIRNSQDLFNIRTMGFRGEAMASIAAVAQVELKTKRPGDDLGTQICIEGSQIKEQNVIAWTGGTSVAVKNVFFNVPARRNFLKSNPVEMRHILDEFHRVALSHPDIAFSLQHNDLEVYRLNPGKLSHRIVALFGKNYQKQLAPCTEDTPLIQIQGYVGTPQNAKKTKGEQFFFVNHRYIRHPYLHHAVMNAYEGLLPEDTYPFYTLFLEIDPVHVDVNIHPTKTEVKFDDERSIYAIVQSAVRKSLQSYNLSPSLDFATDVNFNPSAQIQKTIQENPLYRGSGNFSKPGTKLNQAQIKQWESLYADLEKKAEETPGLPVDAEQTDLLSTTLQSNANLIQNQKGLFDGSPPVPKERNVFQIHQRYVLTPVKSGILLVDQQAARERILFDSMVNLPTQKTIPSQQLLFPKEIILNPADQQLVLEIEAEILNLGFVYSFIDERTLLLKGVPADIIQDDAQAMFEGFLEQFKHFQTTLSLDNRTMAIRSLARKVSSQVHSKLNAEEMNALIDQLFASSNPKYAPDGRPTFIQLSLDRLADFFKAPNELWDTD